MGIAEARISRSRFMDCRCAFLRSTQLIRLYGKKSIIFSHEIIIRGFSPNVSSPYSTPTSYAWLTTINTASPGLSRGINREYYHFAIIERASATNDLCFNWARKNFHSYECSGKLDIRFRYALLETRSH